MGESARAAPRIPRAAAHIDERGDMAGILLPNDDYLTEDELAFFGAMGGYDLNAADGQEREDGPVATAASFEDELPPDPETRELAGRLVSTLIEEGATAFNDFYLDNRAQILDACRFSYTLSRLLVIGLKMGVSERNAFCANTLGTLYYTGDVVEQDYAAAAKLYERAMEWGCYQSIINLGYIYEYGRTGQPDHEKAFRYYALAAAVAPSPEALYKFGDMYSRGKAVERNLVLARVLWQRSYDVADDIEDVAQPAIRLARLYEEPDCEEAGLQPDPLKALSLYQQAEIGLRISVAKGAHYYERRLREAVEGQLRVRELLDADEPDV